MTTLRAAGPEDLAAIGALWNVAIRETAQTFNAVEKSAAKLAALLSRATEAGYAVIVAHEAGRFAGFGTYDQFRGGVGYARTMEHSVYVAPGAQGRGVGRQLLTALEDHARAGGAHCMIAAVGSENAAAIAFHQRMGYTMAATLPQVGQKFGRFMDLILLQKFLT